MTGVETILILTGLALLNNKSKNMKEPTGNIATVLNTAIGAGYPLPFAQLLAAQAIHESANFTSNVFKKNNNAFGMKTPRVRKSPYILGPGTAAPASEGPTPYARYDSLKDSTLDVLHWMQYNKLNPAQMLTAEDYARRLKDKGYYGDTTANYARALKAHLKKIIS